MNCPFGFKECIKENCELYGTENCKEHEEDRNRDVGDQHPRHPDNH
jgi:hypothetical protein